MIVSSLKRFAFVAGIAFLLAAPINAEQCQGNREGKGVGCEKGRMDKPDADKPHRMWDELGLSEEQKGKLKGFHEKQMSVRAASFEKMKALRSKIGDELAKDAPDRKILSSYSSELGEMARIGSEGRIDHMMEMRTILNKEQYQKFIAMQKKRGGEGFGEGMGPQGGDCKGSGCQGGAGGCHHGEGKK